MAPTRNDRSQHTAKLPAVASINATWPQIDPAPFQRRAKNRRSIGTVFAILAVSNLVLTFIFWFPSTFDTLFVFLAVSLTLCIGLGIAMISADKFEERAQLAEQLNRFRSTLDSERAFILFLRSFSSQLVVEKTYRVKTEERESMRMVRSELLPTGRKYVEYTRADEHLDDVMSFLVSSIPATHIVLIDGDVKRLTFEPLVILSPDEKWKEIFHELKLRAQFIVIVPEYSASLSLELQSIKDSELLGKCIFVMPPSRNESPSSDPKSPALSGRTRRQSWEECRDKLDVQLPEYRDSGALLTFARVGGSACRIDTYDSSTLNMLVNSAPQDGSSLGAVLAQLRLSGLLDKTLDELHARAERLLRNTSQ